jgi:hypothetical protein
MSTDDIPSIHRATLRAPVFLSHKATLTFASGRDESAARVVVVTWHQGEEIDWTEQIELTELDVERLRDFCSAWLELVPPDPEAA